MAGSKGLNGIAEVNGARIAYDVAGSGPAVLLLHAGIGDRRMWDAQVPAFAEHFTVIRFDARGFGETRKPDAPFAPYGDAIALLDHLAISQAHFVGVSMGSQTAIEAAIAAPERVSALTAVATRTGTPVSSALRNGWDRVNELYEAGDIAGAVEYELRMWVDGPDRGPDAVDPEIRERVREMNATLFTRDDDAGEEIPLDPPVSERLAEISAPTLIVYGDKDVMDVRQAAEPLVAAILGARLAVIPDAAHLPQMEQPEVFNEIVLEFLLGLDSRGETDRSAARGSAVSLG
jgi:pimeloyl-ACP methyl ester carboxylesterase